MFEVIAGAIWIAVMALFMLGFELVVRFGNADSFDQLAYDSLMLVLWAMILLGVYIVARGAMRIRADRRTEGEGAEAYGLICDIAPTDKVLFNRTLLLARMLVVGADGEVAERSERIGYGRSMYSPGEFVAVKLCESDVNIVGKVGAEEVPVVLREKLKAAGGYDSAGCRNGCAAGAQAGKPNLEIARRGSSATASWRYRFIEMSVPWPWEKDDE